MARALYQASPDNINSIFYQVDESRIAASSSTSAVSFSSAPHNGTLSVAAMCVNNPDRSPLRING
jgi:hypothetical protein